MALSVTGLEIPLAYETPGWPSLYWPINNSPGSSYYLYYEKDIWRFTLYWTLICFFAVHLACSGWAVLMQMRSAVTRRKKHPGLVGETLRWVWIIPFAYLLLAGLEALFAGSIVGVVLGAVYSAGYFKMSTWTPFSWAVINTIALILSSFSIQGGM